MAAPCIGDSARTRSPPIETSNKAASSITSLILSCRIVGTVWLENWLPHVLCIGCVPRRELMKTTNFSSGTSRDTLARLLPSAESGAGVCPLAAQAQWRPQLRLLRHRRRSRSLAPAVRGVAASLSLAELL